jgi:hypothetical protein
MRWLSRKWRVSRNGNPWIASDGYRVTVFRSGARWSAVVSRERDGLEEFLDASFETQDEAKLSAFDHITRLELSDA